MAGKRRAGLLLGATEKGRGGVEQDLYGRVIALYALHPARPAAQPDAEEAFSEG